MSIETSDQFVFQNYDKYSVLTINPEINDAQWGEIESIGTQILQQINGRVQPSVLVDLSQLSYMGSALVALIVRVWKAIKAQNGKIAVYCPNDSVRQVIRLAALEETWNVRSDRAVCFEVLGVSKSAVDQGHVTQLESEVARHNSGTFGGLSTVQLIAGVIVLLVAGVTIGMMISSGDAKTPADAASTENEDSEDAPETTKKTANSKNKPEKSDLTNGIEQAADTNEQAVEDKPKKTAEQVEVKAKEAENVTEEKKPVSKDENVIKQRENELESAFEQTKPE